MADCCNEVKAELAALRAEIAKLKSVDEQKIIDKSVDKAKRVLIPVLGLIIAKEVTARLAPLQALLKKLAPLAPVVSLLLQLAGLLSGILALIASDRYFDVLTNRIDILENEDSKIYRLIQLNKYAAERADAKAEKANEGVKRNTDSILRQSVEIDLAKTLARKAQETANEGISRADTAKAFADRAAEIANIGIRRADRANNRLDDVEPLLDLVNQRVIENTGDIEKLTNQVFQLRIDVDDVASDVNKINSTIPILDSKITNALGEIAGVRKIAENANIKAREAEEIATVSDVKAQAAQIDVAKLRVKVGTLEQQNNRQDLEIKQAKEAAEAALQIGNISLTTAANTAQGLSQVQGQLGDVSNTANKADNKADDALGRISTIKNGVVSDPKTINATPVEINKIKEKQGNTDRDIERIKEKINQDGTGGNNTKEVSREEIEEIKNRLGEGERVNKEGLRKIEDILNKIPLIPGQVAKQVEGRIPSIPAIKQAVGEATCESANSGCINNALNNQANNIKQDVGQKFRDLEQGLNAGANAVQTALLTKIDAKLGAQIVGGISGSLGKFYEWAHIDRALNILTFAATVHNGMMLSNDIAGTFAQILSNVLTLVGIKDKDGNALNIQSLIGSTIENIIKGAIGEQNYTQLTGAFAKANRIYQASANVLNSFQSLTSTVLNALEVTVGRIGKIGNALKKSGEVLENAYTWMNPQPKFNRITQTLESLQNGASTIQMITQTPLDIINATTEMTNASTEFVKAFKEDDKPTNLATPEPEPDILKAAEAVIKEASAGKDIEESDLEADE